MSGPLSSDLKETMKQALQAMAIAATEAQGKLMAEVFRHDLMKVPDSLRRVIGDEAFYDRDLRFDCLTRLFTKHPAAVDRHWVNLKSYIEAMVEEDKKDAPWDRAKVALFMTVCGEAGLMVP